jgi:nitroreductase
MSWKDCEPLQKGLSPGLEQVEYLLKSRRSIRNYKDEPLDRVTLERLIKIASRAPSGHNLQPVQWLVINGKTDVFELASLVCDWMRQMIQHQPEIAESLHFDRVVDSFDKGRDRILRNAPHVVIAHAASAMIASQPTCTIAMTYLELAAWSAGLGACWAGYFTAAAGTYQPLVQRLALPDGHQVFGAMMVGRRKFEYQRIPTRKAPKIEWR